MRDLAVIRTHRWDEDAQRLFAQLRPVFGDDVVTVFHNRPADLVLPLRAADIDDAWLAQASLRPVRDWGWRCGDYSLFRAREAFPDHDRYWVIEPDVFFTGPVGAFFAQAAALRQDVLGVDLEQVPAGHKFARAMPAMPLWRAIFALSRFSGRAIDRLRALRVAHADVRIAPRFFPNDEIFSFTHVMADPDLTCASLAQLLPGWIDPLAIATDPDVLVDLLQDRTSPGVFHPVRGHASFLRAVAGRIVQNCHFMAEIKPSLARLSETDLAAIARDAEAQALAIMRRMRDDALAQTERTIP